MFHPIKRISFFVIFFVGIECPFGQSGGSNSERNTAFQSSSYFFYQQPEYPKDCKDALNQCSALNYSGIHLIKPTGYRNPFEVYCRNEGASYGWTVIGRRLDDSVSFNRSWTDYKNGFGFLSGEFWLGNEKLSYLTNQGVYELLIDLTFSNGSSFYVSYNSLRISDEWSQYAFASIGLYDGDADKAVSYCPLNMIYGTSTYQPTCSNPNDTMGFVSNSEETETCICGDGLLKKGNECVPPDECECFVTEMSQVIPNGEMYSNIDCSVKYTCENDSLSSDINYGCSPNARCIVKDGLGRCHCNEGYGGDGETCSPLYTDCYDAYQAGHREDGVYTIFPSGWPGSPFNVSCVMSANGGGWTVFQRRTGGVTDFLRNWDSYRYGFGSLYTEFWLGNEQLHYLTNQKSYKLRIDLDRSGGSHAEYSSFRVSDSSHNFRIDEISGYTGSVVDGMYSTSGRSFSTYDRDNDECGNHNCAAGHKGAWWYASTWCSSCKHEACSNFRSSSGSCFGECTYSNLNGVYHGGSGENIFWHDERICNINWVEMKIRPSY